MKQLVFCNHKSFEKALGIVTEKIRIIHTSPSNFYKDIRKSEGLVVVMGGNEVINRMAVENKKVNVLLSPEKNYKKDFLLSKNSGLNQVLCKLAKTNNVAIGFDFSYILNSQDNKKINILGRMMQNVKLCKKYKLKMIFSSFANSEYDLRSDSIMSSFSKILGV